MRNGNTVPGLGNVLIMAPPLILKETEADIIVDTIGNVLNQVLNSRTKGPISQRFNIKEEHFAVDIVLKENYPIKSIADGTVIFSEWTSQTGYVIIIIHNYGFMSV